LFINNCIIQEEERKGGKMEKLFGTDGIRGRVNEAKMNVLTCVKYGLALGYYLQNSISSGPSRRAKVILGKDPRRSGYMFEDAIEAGLVSFGHNVFRATTLPTPALSYLIRSMAADFGVMITASHNPYTDNGIKLFDEEGSKLLESVEREIEGIIEEIDDAWLIKHTTHETGVVKFIKAARERHIDFVKASSGTPNLQDLRIVVDCANGAYSYEAPLIFSELGATVIAINNDPNGLNINDGGSEKPEVMRAQVLESRADAGIAFDGDGDRVVMVDERGNYLDGDKILAIIAQDLHSKGKLIGPVVGTVETGLGFEETMKAYDIEMVRTDVGDKNVSAEMTDYRELLSSVGGERSGHIILGDFGTTGDGAMAALRVLSIVAESDETLNEVAQFVQKYEILDRTVEVVNKKPLEDCPTLQWAIATAKQKLGDVSRVLVRYSGTQDVLRISIEGENEDVYEEVAELIEISYLKDLNL
jgi:phosphoglucosamine mutase